MHIYFTRFKCKFMLHIEDDFASKKWKGNHKSLAQLTFL